MSSITVDDLTQELLLSVGIEYDPNAPNGRTLHTEKPSSSPTACAVLKREERTQRQFRDFYQVLIAVLSLLTLLLLAAAAILLLLALPVGALLSGASAIVAGGGALFLLRQRADARKTYLAAQNALILAGC